MADVDPQTMFRLHAEAYLSRLDFSPKVIDVLEIYHFHVGTEVFSLSWSKEADDMVWKGRSTNNKTYELRRGRAKTVANHCKNAFTEKEKASRLIDIGATHDPRSGWPESYSRVTVDVGIILPEFGLRKTPALGLTCVDLVQHQDLFLLHPVSQQDIPAA